MVGEGSRDIDDRGLGDRAEPSSLINTCANASVTQTYITSRPKRLRCCSCITLSDSDPNRSFQKHWNIHFQEACEKSRERWP